MIYSEIADILEELNFPNWADTARLHANLGPTRPSPVPTERIVEFFAGQSDMMAALQYYDAAFYSARRGLEYANDSQELLLRCYRLAIQFECHPVALQFALRAHHRAPNRLDCQLAAAWAHYNVEHYDEAARIASQIDETELTDPTSLHKLATIYYAANDTAKAETAVQRLCEIHPPSPQIRHLRGTIRLKSGNLSGGWADYEARFECGYRPSGAPEGIRPWKGEPLWGSSIVIVMEQGLGDALQFVRYAPIVSTLAAKTIVACRPELMRLFMQIPGIGEVVAFPGQPVRADFFCYSMSIPHILRTELSTIPAHIPYLAADPATKERWRARIAPFARKDGLKVGLAWGGGVAHNVEHSAILAGIDRRRSVPITELSPLLEAPVKWFSLQKGPHAMLANAPQLSHWLVDFTAELGDLLDTAGLAVNMDLVVSVDTSIAHLAGAMGIPVWMLSRFDGCWRWLLNREDSPWYPTMRIYRQSSPGHWEPVIRRVAQDLSNEVERLMQRKPNLSAHADTSNRALGVPE